MEKIKLQQIVDEAYYAAVKEMENRLKEIKKKYPKLSIYEKTGVLDNYPSLHDFYEFLGENSKEFDDLECYKYKFNTLLHTDNLTFDYNVNEEDCVVLDWYVMDSEEYNETICANSDAVEFDGYTLVLIIAQFKLDKIVIGTPLQCLTKALASGQRDELDIGSHDGKYIDVDITVTEIDEA